MIHRHNSRYGKDGCVIVAGEHFATRNDMVIETVLGSCIAVCLRDPHAGVAGMNHFMLPDGGDVGPNDRRAGRFGNIAMGRLIEEMTRLGADRKRMEAKIFGGGNVALNPVAGLRVGEWNRDFVLTFLSNEGIVVSARDIGGQTGRRIVFFTREGTVRVRRLSHDERSGSVERPPRRESGPPPSVAVGENGGQAS